MICGSGRMTHLHRRLRASREGREAAGCIRRAPTADHLRQDVRQATVRSQCRVNTTHSSHFRQEGRKPERGRRERGGGRRRRDRPERGRRGGRREEREEAGGREQARRGGWSGDVVLCDTAVPAPRVRLPSASSFSARDSVSAYQRSYESPHASVLIWRRDERVQNDDDDE